MMPDAAADADADMTLLEEARHNVIAHHMLAAGETAVIAVSGGPDSLCLLHVLRCLHDELGVRLHVAHLNHGLRGEDSDADADFVRQTAAEWGIAATVERADVRMHQKAHGLSLEAAARQVRYAFLERVAGQVGAAAIAVAHTADDQVETVLMHLLRGAGMTGLRGMLPVQRRADGLRLVRPLLTVSRRDIEAYCASEGLHPRLDRSNLDDRLWRNRLRLRIIPYLETQSPRLRETLLRTALILAADDEYLTEHVQALLPGIVRFHDGAATINLTAWRSLAAAVQRRVVREAWRWVAGNSDDLTWAHVEQVRGLAERARVGCCISLPAETRACCAGDELTLVAADALLGDPGSPHLTVERLPLSVPGVTPLPGGPWQLVTTIEPAVGAGMDERAKLCEDFDADVVGAELELRRWRAGDRMQPLGMQGSRKLHDIMTDAHIEKQQRRTTPLLISGQTILWLVGVRRSDWGKVTAHTQRVLRVALVQRLAAE
jgi:tRNA(Ile)-lysidine synthase